MEYQVVAKDWDAHTEPHTQTISLREVIHDEESVTYGPTFTIAVSDAVWQSATPSKCYTFGKFIEARQD